MCEFKGNKCNTTNQAMGATSSLTSIAFKTGVLLERQRIQNLLKDYFRITGEVLQGDLVKIIEEGQHE